MQAYNTPGLRSSIHNSVDTGKSHSLQLLPTDSHREVSLCCRCLRVVAVVLVRGGGLSVVLLSSSRIGGGRLP